MCPLPPHRVAHGVLAVNFDGQEVRQLQCPGRRPAGERASSWSRAAWARSAPLRRAAGEVLSVTMRAQAACPSAARAPRTHSATSAHNVRLLEYYVPVRPHSGECLATDRSRQRLAGVISAASARSANGCDPTGAWQRRSRSWPSPPPRAIETTIRGRSYRGQVRRAHA